MPFKDNIHRLQRLNLPRNPVATELGGEQMAFPQEAMDIIKDHVAFDYMGQREFGGVSVPLSLARMIENKSSLAIAETELTIPAEACCDPRYEDALKLQYPDGKTVKTFIIASEDMLDDATLMAFDLAKEPAERDHYFARIPSMIETGVYKDEITEQKVARGDILPVDATVGWLDINNDVMIFTDPKMFSFFKKDVFGLN